MLIAREKRKQNIAEYILYMYQVEDMIRACRFDLELIENRVISQYSVSERIKMEIRDWYSDIIVTMHEEGLKNAGHTSFLKALVSDLNFLHLKLLNEIGDSKYYEQYIFARNNIRDFGRKLGPDTENEIEVCLSALYALLLLRIQKKVISRETLEAMQTFSNLLAVLSAWYKKVETGEIKLGKISGR
jgi:hypothetical protein